MKRFFAALITIALLLTRLAVGEAADTADEVVTVVPARDNTMLLNPGKGWVQYYGPDQYTRDYISVGYTRWPWSAIEPEEGRFNWKEIDEFIALFRGYGKKAAFGVMSVSTGLGREYVTPKWVFDAGAAPLAIPDDSTPSREQYIAKTWDDPLLLAKLKAFVRALGKHCDGHPDLAFIDIRSYGNWGEGHIGMLKAPGIILTPPKNLQENYLQPYFDAFPHTQLIVPWGWGGYDGIYDWAVSQGAGIRRDGILSEWSRDGSECLRAHGRAPAVFEYCSSYAEMKKTGWWKPELLRNTYCGAGKPTYMQWDSKIFEENRDFCLSLGNAVGYHFVLEKAELPRVVQLSAPCRMKLHWFNDGVAFLYQPCHVAVALLDDRHRVIEKQWLTEIHPGSWPPGQGRVETAAVEFSAAEPGRYQLAVGLFLGREDAQRAYRLGIQGKTDTNWYVLRDVELVK